MAELADQNGPSEHREIVTKMSATPAEYALLRRVRQLQRQLTNPVAVVDITIEVTPTNIYLLQTRQFERIALD